MVRDVLPPLCFAKPVPTPVWGSEVKGLSMDEVITCPKCCKQVWIIGTSGTRCVCGWWLSKDSDIYEFVDDFRQGYEECPDSRADLQDT